jgi:hypothetical protein
MIWLGLGLLLASILFGGPALAALIRHQTAQRRQAAEALRQAEEESKGQARAAQEQVDYVWRNSPDRAGVGEYLKYLAYKTRLEQAANGAGRRVAQCTARVEHCLSRYPDGQPPSTRYRLVVLVGSVFFLAAIGLAIALDYLIFRGLHPTGAFVLPLGLACIAVLGITVGSVIMFGARRHDLLPASITIFFRQVIIVGGAVLALGVAAYMTAIAPNRSAPAGQAAITKAEQVLQADQSAVPASSPQLIAVDQQGVTQAKANLARAEEVDRLSAAALAFVEIPLSEAAVLGGELLVLQLAIARRDRALEERHQAEDAVVQADRRFIFELTQVLIKYGHNEESMRRIVERVNAMNSPTGARPIAFGGGAPPGAIGAGSPPTGSPTAVNTAPGAAGPVTVPLTGPVPGGPTGNVVPPGGPGPTDPLAGGPPPEMATIASLPADELDQTE